MKKILILLFISLHVVGQNRYTKDIEFDLLHTELHLKPIWENQTLEGNAKITLQPHFYPQNQVVLNAKDFILNKITLDKKELNYSYDNRILKINLPKTVTRSQTITLEIDYIAQPNRIQIQEGEENKSEKGLYFINPTNEIKGLSRQLWTQGETQSNSSWFPTIDQPNQNHTQDIYLKIQSNLVSLSNGILVGSKISEDGYKIDHWKQDIPHAVYLTMIAVGDFVKIIDSNFGRFEVSYYMEREYSAYAQSIFGRTPEMINYFESILGVKYPWQKYAQIPVRKFVSGAMENTTATTHASSVLKNNHQIVDNHDDAIIAHELFHHWFGNFVTTESWSHLTLNEAFANYSEFLWLTHKYGKQEGDFAYYNDLNTYLSESENSKKSLIRYDYSSSEEMFDAHSYQKGGRVLHMLRMEVGDEAFFKSIQLYLQENALKAVETDHLRLTFEKVTGRDLKWFFDQWFHRSGHPVVTIKHNVVNSILSFNVNQNIDSTEILPYRFNMPVRIITSKNVIDTVLTIKELENNFSIPLNGDFVNFVPNADGYFLGEISDDRSLREYIHQGFNSKEIFAKIKALEAGIVLNEFEKPLENDLYRSFVIQCLDDESPRIRQMAVQIFYDYDGPEFLNIEKKLENIIVNDSNANVRADAIIAIKNFKNPKHLDLALQAMKDTSYYVRSMALEYLMENEHKSVDSLVQLYEDIKDGSLFATIANYYVATQTPNKLDWMLDRLSLLEGIEMYQYVGLLGSYLVVNEPSLIQKSLPLLRKVAIEEDNWFNRMAGVQVLYVLKDITDEAKLLFEEAVKSEKNPNLINSYKQFNVE